MNIITYTTTSQYFIETLQDYTANTLYVPTCFQASNIQDILIKIIDSIDYGFVRTATLITINEQARIYCIDESELEHFKEDLTLILLKKPVRELIYLSKDQLNRLAIYTTGSSYDELIASRAVVHESDDERYIKIKNLTIFRNQSGYKDNAVEFSQWFDTISLADFTSLWQKRVYQQAIKFLRRYPGGYHEWLMCSRTLKLKQLQIPASLLNKLITPTHECKFVLQDGGKPHYHGFTGSSTMHNQLAALIDHASSAQELYTNLHDFINRRLCDDVDGKADLLEILSQYID